MTCYKACHVNSDTISDHCIQLWIPVHVCTELHFTCGGLVWVASLQLIQSVSKRCACRLNVKWDETRKIQTNKILCCLKQAVILIVQFNIYYYQKFSTPPVFSIGVLNFND